MTALLLLLAGLGLLTGFLSGLLGIGGGIVMAPLLLYVPPFFGFEELSMKTVAGLTVVQGLCSCIIGGLTHRRFQFSSPILIGWMGATIFLCALAGGAGSHLVGNKTLLLILALLALAAAILLFVPTAADSDAPDLAAFSFSRPRAVLAAGTVGFLGGLVGQGGSFLLIPLMTSFLQVPTRIAIGSNLGIVFLSTLAAFLGKAATGQINWLLTVPILLTACPATHLGALASRRTPVFGLRALLAAAIAIAALRIGFSALYG